MDVDLPHERLFKDGIDDIVMFGHAFVVAANLLDLVYIFLCLDWVVPDISLVLVLDRHGVNLPRDVGLG